MVPTTSTAAAAGTVRPSALLAPLGVWLALAVLAVANGAFREVVLIPRVGEHTGHVVSTLVLVAVIFAVSAAFFASTDAQYATAELVTIGVVWTVLTVGFEFLVGYVEGTPVSVTVGQYDVFAGQVWILVPLSLLVAPLVFGRAFAG